MSTPVLPLVLVGLPLGTLLTAEAVGQANLGREVPLTRQHLTNREELRRLADVVDPEDVDAGVDPVADCGQGPGEPLPRRPGRDRADEVLPGRREQQRAAEAVERREPAHQLDGLRRRLAEVGTRVEHQLLKCHPASERQLGMQFEFVNGAESQELAREIVASANTDPEALDYLLRLAR